MSQVYNRANAITICVVCLVYRSLLPSVCEQILALLHGIFYFLFFIFANGDSV